jgi:alkylation response protein AidB-like acyl-CoA dehydrogenase
MALQHKLTGEQQIISDSAAALFRDASSSAHIREFIDSGKFAAASTRLIGDSGLLGICTVEAAGGAGLGAVAALAIATAAGKHCVPWPVAESIVAASLLVSSHPTIAGDVIQAKAIIAIASQGACTGTRNGRKLRLSGSFRAVAWATGAARLIVPINVQGNEHLALVNITDQGVQIDARKSIDATCPLAGITLLDVEVDESDLLSAFEPRWRELLTILAAAELLGAAQTCLNLAVEYMKVRKQFGQEIGRFQALKHIAANDALSIENMQLAVNHAAWAFDAKAPDAAMSLHIAKEYCSERARTVAEDAIQCHGGIGFTWDYDLQLYLRRILRLAASFGTGTEHREAIASALIAELSPRAGASA